MTYIPRLSFDGESVSKTTGKYQLRKYREKGIDPNAIIGGLALDVMKRYDYYHDIDQWGVENIKVNPVLGDWARELLK